VSARAHAGLVTELDVNQQRTQLAATRAQLPLLDAQTRVSAHAIAILLAEPPDALSNELSRAAPVPVMPPSVPVGLPSELVRRRPDVRAAERQLAGATAEIGIAVAQLYPKFNLIGAASLAGNQLSNLGSSRNLTEIGLGLVRWPLLQGGTLRANVRSREAQRDQAYLSYQRTVLGALQDTEDALARCGADRQRLSALEESVTAAASSAHLAEAQYRAGFVTFINVLDASAADLSAQDQVAQSNQSLAQDLVSLYKALGGGWASDQPPPP
jgi:NodT family efflux transporter outer membrane factor (OMF) lipoprotein